MTAESALATKTGNAERTYETYVNAVRKNFSFLKQTTRLDELWAKSIAMPGDQGYLQPVCELHTSDEELISTFSLWRSENAFAYPSQFEVTNAGTAKWLRANLLDVEDRILFLVLDKQGRRVGHLGFANAINEARELEIDNVVRGVKDGNPGLMSLAMQTLLDWADEMIGQQHVSLRVFSDNEHAINFYRRLGFEDAEMLPLRKHVEASGTYYRTPADGDTAEADKQFLRMVRAPEPMVDGSQLILTAGPSMSAREVSYAYDAARYGWNNQWSKYIKKFETSFAEYLGVKHALSTSSCTGALHLALLALGIGPGDEVIVPDITWVATANAVVYVGATPIFADIESGSWCIDPESLASLITERTKAIIPVHLYGHPARMDQVMAIAKEHNLHILEDAAPSIGAEFQGQKVGTFGHFAAFSFQGAKLAVTGEGGMLVTNDDALYEKVYALWDQGRTPGTFWINEIGWKYKMSNIQAALGLGQLERIDELIEAKRRIFSWYAEGLQDLPSIQLNYEMPWARSIYWMASIVLDENAKLSRDDLRKALHDRNVDTRPVFPAISQYPIWPKAQSSQPVATYIGNQAINLPSGVRLKRKEVDYVCRCIREILQ